MKKILVIGGSGFVGRTLTETIIASGKYDLTLFNRGKTNSGLFKGLKHIQGDRNSDDIAKIATQEWDAIIDVIGYYPDSVKKTLQTIKGHCKRYIYVSTLSLFDFENIPSGTLISETHPSMPCTTAQRTAPIREAYNEQKAECEREILAVPDVDSIIMRPSLIVGPYDPTDRLYYWLYRAKTQSHILYPEGDYPTHVTYAPDFANALMEAIELENHQQVYNVPTVEIKIDELLQLSSQLLGTSPQLLGMSEAFIEKHKLIPWVDIPAWVGSQDFLFTDTRIKSDFKTRFTPLKEVLLSTFKWHDSIGWEVPKYGLSLEREVELTKEL